MKYVYIILIGALLIGCGSSDDGDKGNSSGGTSAKGGNKPSSTSTKGDSTSGTPAKGDNISSPKYIEGDIVVILKNANKTTAKFYSSSMRAVAKEQGLKTLSKDVESESCVSLGFVYKTTINDENVIVKEFNKGEVVCSEQTITNNAQVGNINILFLLRK